MTHTESVSEFATFLLQALVVALSMFAGMFWMNAASVSRQVEPVFWPWRIPKFVTMADDPAAHQLYQAKWNARAAFCACIAALAQAVLFMIDKYPTLPL
jgi:hypothetical protein